MKNLSIRKKISIIFICLLVFGSFVLFNFHTSVTENLHSYEYTLPYNKGTKHKVVQGYGGLFTHGHVAALDFEMPVGTPIVAAREGIIYGFREDSDEGGFLPKNKTKANYIIIQHSDGSLGCYWHLQKNSVLVKKGFVSKGQPIALSGATGQVVSPHLHFSVKNKLDYSLNSFVRTKFKTTRGSLILKDGNTYESPMD